MGKNMQHLLTADHQTVQSRVVGHAKRWQRTQRSQSEKPGGTRAILNTAFETTTEAKPGKANTPIHESTESNPTDAPFLSHRRVDRDGLQSHSNAGRRSDCLRRTAFQSACRRHALLTAGICFWREGLWKSRWPDRRAGKRGKWVKAENLKR